MHNKEFNTIIDELKDEISNLKKSHSSLQKKLKARKWHAIIGIFLSFLTTTLILFAAQISKPHDFKAYDTISASQINANFDALYETAFSKSDAVADAVYYNKGNVGIGTDSPAFEFDVNGNANVTGNMTIGGNATVTGGITTSSGITGSGVGVITYADVVIDNTQSISWNSKTGYRITTTGWSPGDDLTFLSRIIAVNILGEATANNLGSGGRFFIQRDGISSKNLFIMDNLEWHNITFDSNTLNFRVWYINASIAH